MLCLALSTLILALAGLRAQWCHYEHLKSRRAHKNTAELAATLEAKMADLDELKVKVNQLLLARGLGRT